MKIVGVGCGPGMLTEAAIAAIRGADLICGSGRAIALARPYIRQECEVREIEDYRRLRELPDAAVVLSTGDPMLAGLGSLLSGEIVPGISSMQLAFARLRIPLVRSAVISAHGKDHARAVNDAKDEILKGRVAFIIADPQFSVKALAEALPPACRIAVCEDLGYPEERIARGTAEYPPAVKGTLFVVVAGDF